MYPIIKEDAIRSVGPGWTKFIESIYSKLPEYAVVVQVKEKFGGLRVYVDFDADPTADEIESFRIDDTDENFNSWRQSRMAEQKKFYDFLSRLESKSHLVCEDCGAPGTTGKVGSGYWLLTLCDKDREARASKREENR